LSGEPSIEVSNHLPSKNSSLLIAPLQSREFLVKLNLLKWGYGNIGRRVMGVKQENEALRRLFSFLPQKE
jgi:hypothetical protein